MSIKYSVLTSAEAFRKMRFESREFLYLASTPNDEPCIPAGGSFTDAQIECTAYINQLKRMYPDPPEGIQFAILQQVHEFGIYHEAIVFYDYNPEPDEQDYSTDQAYYEAHDHHQEHPAQTYACQLENGPDKWDEEALAELATAGYSLPTGKVVKLKTA